MTRTDEDVVPRVELHEATGVRADPAVCEHAVLRRPEQDGGEPARRGAAMSATRYARHATAYTESDPRKYGCTGHVADRNRTRFTASPIAAAVTGAIPRSVPSPTAISTNAMATPVSTGACSARCRSGEMGLPGAKLRSCCPM